jgi:Leucine-rich repeat (LRR) protein
MEKIKQELKSMQSNPNFYLANYFSDLKRDVDLTFFGKDGDEKAKYLEIINKIEDIEQEYYRRSKPFNTFNHEIEIEKIEQNDHILRIGNRRFKRDVQEIESLVELDKQSINDLKYKIEQKLFQNKTILFMKDYCKKQKTFLLILTNAYLRKNTFYNLFKAEYFDRETLIANFILEQQFNKNIEELDALNGLKTLKEIDFSSNSRPDRENGQIKELDPATLNGLTSLKKINFSYNQITHIHPSTFNGLTNLEAIWFQNNEIKELDPATLNGLTSLKKINFSDNQITNIHPSTFNGLTNLEAIWFENNKIKELDPTTFNGLNCLKEIIFSYNQITKIHPSTFNGLNNLVIMKFVANNIIELDRSTFNGLTVDFGIRFEHNPFTLIKPLIYKGLIQLSELLEEYCVTKR